MEDLLDIKKPSKEEQITAKKSYDDLEFAIQGINDEMIEIEIEETQERVTIPLKALKLLAQVLKAMGEGKPISIVPVATEMTTQSAAEFLGCSRPHVVKLLETGKIPFTKIGKHRRIKFEDIATYKKVMKEEQKRLLIEMMRKDEESGLYDS